MARFFTPFARVADNNGKPLPAAKLYFFENETGTPKDTFSDVDLTIANANPVIADSQGQFGPIFLDLAAGAYRVRLDDENDVTQPGYPEDDVGTVVTAESEWLIFPATPTFIDTTNFSVVGDQTEIFQVNRRVKAEVTAGTVYGTITASAFAASITTVTVSLDSGVLDSGLSSVAYGILSVLNPSLPEGQYIVADATLRTHAPNVGQIQDGGFTYVVDTGAADVYVADFSPAYPAYVAGMIIAVKITNANLTATPTLNVNSIGAKTVKKINGLPVSVGDLPTGYIAEFVYDGTDFILLNPANLSSLYFGDGSDGALSTSGSAAITGGIKNYTTVNINTSDVITLSTHYGIIMFATESITIDGTLSVDSRGGLGGAAGSASVGSTGEDGFAAGGGGGGGGGSFGGGAGGTSRYLSLFTNGGAGGATSSAGGVGTSVADGSKPTVTFDMRYGSGGGGGGTGGAAGAGGRGGGFILLIAPTIIVNASGTLSAKGNDGADGTSGAAGGGGGGAGGGIVVWSMSYTNTGTVLVNPGAGGNPSSTGGQGGNGGSGFIEINDI